ncbi:hypothetical protein [Halovivax cerinus]|uniref:Uncharacterized protein n=1 Tax=Halovivax cerinus TaxID=1487865 RepID=A0ABD5NSN0_9EURY|nr:hypothetical protein [Halovivax cerinus]
MMDYAFLVVGILAAIGVVRILASTVINGGDTEDVKGVGALFIVLAAVGTELVPSRFLTVTPAIDRASDILIPAVLILGLALLFGPAIRSRWS